MAAEEYPTLIIPAKTKARKIRPGPVQRWTCTEPCKVGGYFTQTTIDGHAFNRHPSRTSAGTNVSRPLTREARKSIAAPTNDSLVRRASFSSCCSLHVSYCTSIHLTLNLRMAGEQMVPTYVVVFKEAEHLQLPKDALGRHQRLEHIRHFLEGHAFAITRISHRPE